MKVFIAMLQVNQTIWAVNVGESEFVSQPMWRAFANALPQTSVIHLYAGSEASACGELKVQMRDAIRANRSKHTMHCHKRNEDVIKQVNNMWWILKVKEK